MASTQIRTTLELRSTVRGANNRLDPLSIKSYDNAASTPLSVGELVLLSVGPVLSQLRENTEGCPCAVAACLLMTFAS